VNDEDLAYGRLERLYDLFDTDHDGTVSFEELAVGLRSFQCTKDVEVAVNDSLEAFLAVDENGDQRLDKAEFTNLLAKFAAASQTDLHALVDFMLIHIVLDESPIEDKEYISKMLKKKERRSNRTNLFQRAKIMAGRMMGDGGEPLSWASTTFEPVDLPLQHSFSKSAA
jgi:Ca2+-binding EF-hand superfamily protein